MARRTQDIVVGLSQTELKIIDALQKDAEISYRQVASSTGLSESWVSTKINHLKNRYVLVGLTTAPNNNARTDLPLPSIPEIQVKWSLSFPLTFFQIP